MIKKARTFNETHLNEKVIVIYGASAWGELAFRALETLGIMPHFFCDRAASGQTRFGVPVISPNELEDVKDAAILIASADFFDEMRDFLDNAGLSNYYDITWLLERRLPRGILSNRAADMLDNSYLYEEAVTQYADDELRIVHLGFAVTERCTLNCRDCSFLMPHYKHPRDIDLDMYKHAFDRLLKAVDRITELRLYGGEPFMNRDMYKMIEWYRDSEKIRHISIYTNGTIIPGQAIMESMKHPKVKVHISDYGLEKNRSAALAEVLEREDIAYFLRTYDEWQLGGGLAKRGYGSDKLKDVYEKCFMTNCYSFLKGRLYGCPRAAHGINMGATPDAAFDYVNFTNEGLSVADSRKALIELMHHRDFLFTCDYCDGFNNKVKGVRAGIQA